MRSLNRFPQVVPTIAARSIHAFDASQDAGSEAPPGMSLTQVLAILRSSWKMSAIIFVSVTVLAAIGLKFMPKTYTAMATLIVDTSQKDPLAGQEFPVALLNNYVATQTELMTGPVILLPVLDRLNLTKDKEFTADFHGDPQGLRDYVARNLANALQVDQGRGGQLLYVNASAHEAVKAANIANAVADVYLELERRRLNVPAGQRAQRYSEQIAELRGKVAAEQDKVDAFRRAKGITDIGTAATPDAPDAETQALDNVETRLIEAQNARRALEAKQVGNQASSDETIASPQIQQLQSQLHALETQKVQMSTTYGALHPKLRELKAQIATTQQELAVETGKLGDNNVTQLVRARALEEKYTRAVAEQRTKVLALRDVQGEGGKLTLELESAQAVYKRALDGYDQIMFASVGDYQNVTVVSRATPPIRASKPNKLKLLLLAIVGGIGLAVVLPFSYEMLFNRRVRCREDIERSFGIPVLMQFESLLTSAEHI